MNFKGGHHHIDMLKHAGGEAAHWCCDVATECCCVHVTVVNEEMMLHE
jgi:hypothetical protein